MKKARGIVMKTTKKTTIIFSDSGDYLKIKTPEATPSVGQVIEVELPVHTSLSSKLLKISSVAAVLLLALTLSVFNLVSGTNTAAAAVVIDMNAGTNTSMELLIGREAKVLGVNKASENTPSSLDLQGMDIYAAINLIIDTAHNQGVFNQDNSLILTSIIPMDNQRAEVIDQAKLRDSIEHHIVEKKIAASMMVLKTDEKTKKAAQSLGMSVNHYQIYQRILEQGTIKNADASYSEDTLHMLTEANTTLVTLFPHDSMTIAPQKDMNEETSNSMGNSMMTGETMQSMDSYESNTSQNTNNVNQTPNESVPSPSTMPNSQHGMEDPSNSMSMPTQEESIQPDGTDGHQIKR